MSALHQLFGGLVAKGSGRLILGVALGTAGLSATASAHDRDEVRLDVDLRGGHVDFDRHHFVPDHCDVHEERIWVEAVYRTEPGERVWVEPVYRAVCDHVWRDEVCRDDAIQVFVPPHAEERVIRHGDHFRRETCVIPGHYEGRINHVIVAAGHFEDVTRQELVAEGHWQCEDRQVLVTPAHWETRVERVPVADGHWEDRPLIRLH